MCDEIILHCAEANRDRCDPWWSHGDESLVSGAEIGTDKRPSSSLARQTYTEEHSLLPREDTSAAG